MKTLLLAVNLLLATLVVWSAAKRFGAIAGGPQVEYTVKKTPRTKPSSPVKPQKIELPRNKIQDPVATLIEKNIFDQDRCPNANVPGGRNTRVELSLVGTFTVGSSAGAIILQKTSAGNRNFWNFMGGFPGGPGGPAGGRQMGIANQGGSNRNGPRGSNQNGPRGRRAPGGRNRTGNTRTAQGIDNRTQGNVVYKQYVRLGETLSNGYTLTEVNFNKVTLRRGSDKLELELLDASQNAPQTAQNQNRRTSRGNQFMQIMQNMQRMQFMQNMQMMRMMRDNRRGAAPPAPPNPRTNNRARGR